MSGIDFKPSFQVEKITGEFHRMVMHIEEDVREVGPLKDKKIISRKLVPKREVFTEAYMVYFPQGHSLFIPADDEEQLRRIGVLEQPRMIDMNSGEEVPGNYVMTPKELVEARTKAKYRPRQTGGLATLDGEGIE
jgi:hypothetical protein